MALPNTNISTTLVGQTLGTSSRDVGTLCTHPNINKWSRWKPVRLNKVSGLTESDIAASSDGLVVPTVNGSPSIGYNAIMAYYRNNPNLEWQYLKPRGGAYNEPFRLGDFRNYDHNAIRFYDFSVPNTVFTNKVNATLFIDSYPTLVNWSGLNFTDLHFGIVMVKKGQTTPSTVQFSESPLTIGNSNILVTIDPTPTVNTSYDIFSFLSLPPESEDPDYLFCFLLEEGHKEFTFMVLYLTVDLTAEKMGDGAIDYSLRLVNNATTAPETIIQCELYIKYADNTMDDELEPFETLVSLGNIVVPANGGVAVRSDALYGLLPDFNSRGGHIYFQNNSHPTLNRRIDIVSS